MKNKLFIFVALGFLLVGCNNKVASNDPTKINDDLRLEVLNAVLKDTANISILRCEPELISNIPIFPPSDFFYFDSITDSFKKSNSKLEYLSAVLEINDTIYIKNQISSNKEFDLSLLSQRGYKIFNIGKFLDDGINIDSIDVIAEEYFQKMKIEAECQNYFFISKPLFNKERNSVFVKIAKRNAGVSVLFSKKDGKWKFNSEIEKWVE